ncbi:AsmA family protein, partial [Amnimonas aquatica]
MKRVLLWLGAGLGVVVLSVSAVLAYVVFVLDPNDYKQELADVVKQKTDMDLALKGDLAWQLWPSIGIRLGETSLTDPVLKETLAEVKQAAVSVELLPLLSGRASIDAVLVDGAAVRFVQYADGRTSWDRLLEKLKSPDEEEQSEQVAFDIEKL